MYVTSMAAQVFKKKNSWLFGLNGKGENLRKVERKNGGRWGGVGWGRKLGGVGGGRGERRKEKRRGT